MAAPRRAQGPTAPRIAAPDLAPVLEPLDRLARHDDVLGARVVLTATTDAAHARLAESVVVIGGERLDLEGASLTDVRFDEPRLVELRAPRSRWRSTLLEGGRIGTLDLAGAELDSVEARGVRIDYLSLAQARVQDLLLVDCVLRTLDLPLAVLERVRFDGCRVDEVDTRELRAKDLDLRGLEALGFTDPASLRGATMSQRQVLALAPEFAAALGIRLA